MDRRENGSGNIWDLGYVLPPMFDFSPQISLALVTALPALPALLTRISSPRCRSLTRRPPLGLASIGTADPWKSPWRWRTHGETLRVGRCWK